MRIHRQNPLLNDVIEALDGRLREAHGSVGEAWTRLTPTELEFVKDEIKNCALNRIYYLQNYHTIQNEQGQLMGMFPLFSYQLLLDEAIVEEVRINGKCFIIVGKPRQSGISEYSTGTMCHCTFYTPRAYTLSVAQDPSTAAHMQRKVNIAWENLPWWMRPERLYHSKGEYLEFNRQDDKERMLDPGLGSVYVTTHAQRTSGVAIGRTVRYLHLSEVSRWASGEIYTADIEPALNASDTIAIAESTALGDEGFFYNLWQEADSGDSDWKPFFLPAYRAKKFSLPLKPSQKPFVLTEQETAVRERVKVEEKFFVTDEFFNWRRVRIKAAIRRTGHPYAHYESYPITAQEMFQSSGILVLPRHKLDEQNTACVKKPRWIGEILFQGTGAAPKLLLREIKPDEALEKREYENRLWVWEEPEPNAAYYMGVDTSLGNGGNMSAAEVLRAGSGMNPDVQVAEWVGWIPPTEWAKVLYALGNWYNRCEIAVEYQAEGMTTANYLMNDLQYPNLYRPRHRDRFGRQLLSYLHWQTTGKTKPLLASKIVESLLENSVKIQSGFLMSQFYKLTAYKFDRMGNALSFEAEIGDDDAALAFIICLFCLRETMMELRVPDELPAGEGRTATRSASIYDVGRGPVTYGIYDEFFRQRTQLTDLQSAQKLVKANPGWSIREIPISKANTFYSTIHHGSGVENELYRQGGDSWEITPAVVQAYRSAGDQKANPLLQPTETGRRSAQPPPSGEDLIGLSGANEMDG